MAPGSIHSTKIKEKDVFSSSSMPHTHEHHGVHHAGDSAGASDELKRTLRIQKSLYNPPLSLRQVFMILKLTLSRRMPLTNLPLASAGNLNPPRIHTLAVVWLPQKSTIILSLFCGSAHCVYLPGFWETRLFL